MRSLSPWLGLNASGFLLTRSCLGSDRRTYDLKLHRSVNHLGRWLDSRSKVQTMFLSGKCQCGADFVSLVTENSA